MCDCRFATTFFLTAHFHSIRLCFYLCVCFFCQLTPPRAAALPVCSWRFMVLRRHVGSQAEPTVSKAPALQLGREASVLAQPYGSGKVSIGEQNPHTHVR